MVQNVNLNFRELLMVALDQSERGISKKGAAAPSVGENYNYSILLKIMEHHN